MSRLAGAVFAVALCVLAPGARAQTRLQGPASARVLLARAESLWTQLARQDSAVNRRTYLERRARRFDAGPVTALVPAVVGAETGFRLAASADEYLRGAVPPAFVASRVIVAHAATAVDSVVRAQRLADRVALGAYVAPPPTPWPTAGRWRPRLPTTTEPRSTRLGGRGCHSTSGWRGRCAMTVPPPSGS